MTAALRCAVIGYASVDYKYATNSFRGPGRTTLVRHPLHVDGAQPGAVAYFALGLARHAVPVDLVTWVGPDDDGTLFIDRLAADDVDVRAVSRTGTRSPSCHMYGSAQDEPVVFFDPGDVDQSLTPLQQQTVADAGAVLVGVGPTKATAAALAAANPSVPLVWAVKADPGSVTPDLAQALASRADVICHSENEVDFLVETCGLDLDGLRATGTTLARTRGDRGALLLSADDAIAVNPVGTVATADATGAGDTFAAGLLARLLDSAGTGDDLREVAEGACADARMLLRSRSNER